MIDKYKYTDTEFKDLLGSIGYYYDTREKEIAHLVKHAEQAGIVFKRKKLDYGDVTAFIPASEKLHIPREMIFDRELFIERKASLDELVGNLLNDRARLEKELSLAPPRRLLLIENAKYEDILLGNYRSKMLPKSLWSSYHSLVEKYGLETAWVQDNSKSFYYIMGFCQQYIRKRVLR